MAAGAIGHTCGVRVDGPWTRPFGREVSEGSKGSEGSEGSGGGGGGFAAGCVEGLCSLRSGGDSGSAAEGGGGALRAQIIKKPARALRHFDESRSAANRKASYCAG